MPVMPNKKSKKNGTVNKPSKEYLFKVLVIGELATGKTSFIKRYVHQYFSDHYKATIGVDFALKVKNLDDNTVVRLQLWDIAGQERFGNMTRVYYKEAVGAFISFDVSRPDTLQHTINWKEDLDRKVTMPDGSTIPCVLIANKCDMPKKGICADEDFLNKFCEENNIGAWFYASPKENINIEESTNFLIDQIIQKQKSLIYTDSEEDEIVNLNLNQFEHSNNSKKCNC